MCLVTTARASIKTIEYDGVPSVVMPQTEYVELINAANYYKVMLERNEQWVTELKDLHIDERQQWEQLEEDMNRELDLYAQQVSSLKRDLSAQLLETRVVKILTAIVIIGAVVKD